MHSSSWAAPPQQSTSTPSTPSVSQPFFFTHSHPQTLFSFPMNSLSLSPRVALGEHIIPPLETGSRRPTKPHRPLPDIPRSCSMSSLRGITTSFSATDAPMSARTPREQSPHSPYSTPSPQSNMSSVHGIMQRSSSVSYVNGRGLRPLPRTPDALTSSDAFPEIAHRRSPHRPQTAPTHGASLRRGSSLKLTRPHTTESRSAAGPSYSHAPLRAHAPRLSLITSPAMLKLPPSPCQETCESPVSESLDSELTLPLASQVHDRPAQDALERSFLKLQRVLTPTLPPDLFFSPVSVEDDDDEPISAIEFAPPIPGSLPRSVDASKPTVKSRSKWQVLTDGIRTPGSFIIGSESSTEKRRFFSHPKSLSQPMPAETTGNGLRPGRMIRNWVREQRGKRWVEDDYQGIVMELRMLRA